MLLTICKPTLAFIRIAGDADFVVSVWGRREQLFNFFENWSWVIGVSIIIYLLVKPEKAISLNGKASRVPFIDSLGFKWKIAPNFLEDYDEIQIGSLPDFKVAKLAIGPLCRECQVDLSADWGRKCHVCGGTGPPDGTGFEISDNDTDTLVRATLKKAQAILRSGGSLQAIKS